MKIVVVNPGTHPEPRELAIGLTERGHAVTYVTSSQFAQGPTARLFRAVAPKRLRPAIDARALPQEFGTTIAVRSGGRFLEALFQISLRVLPVWAPEIMVSRTRSASRTAARIVRRAAQSDKPFDIVIAQQTSANAPFQVAREGTLRALMQPIVDQSWLESVLAQDAIESPDWAFALQGLARPRRQLADIIEESSQADVFLAGSELVATTLNCRTHQRTLVAHYGVNEAFLQEQAPRSFRDTGRLNVLFVGQVNQRKGIAYLLEAMRLLGEDCELRVVGPINERVKSKISRLALANVTVVGPVDQSRLLREYRRADVLVLPSLGEGFALVVPEAMSTGLPCVVTDRTGSHEVIITGRNGLIVAAQDSNAIAEALRALREDPDLLRRMSAAAAETAQRLTWAAYRREASNEIEVFARQVSRAKVLPSPTGPHVVGRLNNLPLPQASGTLGSESNAR